MHVLWQPVRQYALRQALFIVFETQCEEGQLPVLSHKEDTLNILSNRTEHSNKYRYQGIFPCITVHNKTCITL
ncbi:hypothetical protein C0J52_10690 [Blattella germanica]|nr:hypothetical protein C0J52_10690 [Blattella germanica]